MRKHERLKFLIKAQVTLKKFYKSHVWWTYIFTMFEQFIIKSQLFNHSALERMELKNINIIFLKEYLFFFFFKNIYF